MRIVALVALCVLLATSVFAAPSAAVQFPAGMTLTDALLQLQQHGLKLVFSSQVVPPEMRVKTDARGVDLRRLVEEILAPHALGIADENGVLVVIRKQEPAPSPKPEQVAPPAQPVWSEEIVVQPSRISLLVEEPLAPVSLTRADIQALPHLGDDVFRTLRLLPGTTSADLSAELHLRGGRRDEVLIRLDGQELYDPYHLKEYDNALSIVSASALAKADLITAAFPVSYGDRMGGVLDMTTIAPPGERRVRLVASIIGVQVEAGDAFRNGRTGWFASLRRGNTDLLGRAFQLEGPSFWDFFGKIENELTPRQSLGLRVLASADRLSFTVPDSKELRTDYSNAYVWLTHRASNGRSLFVDTIASFAQVERDRRGFETDEERMFRVRDERLLGVTGLTQSWSIQSGGRHFVTAGVELRQFDAQYDYAREREFETPLAAIRADAVDGVFAETPRLRDEQFGGYASDRVRLSDAITVDAGARFDRHTSTGEGMVSPRLNGAWAFAQSTVLRLGWGHFLQSQRAHELMIEDSDLRLYPVERSRQWVVGVEHLFDSSVPLPLSNVRVEAYQRRVSNPRPRYENLLGPFDPFPEGEFDRVRIEPERATATGIEVLVHGRPTPKVQWFLNYTLASTTDRIDGDDVPRSIDQRHALNADVNRRLGNGWNVNLAWVFRTGHPTTQLTVDENLEPVLGPSNSVRLPSYHRLDLRLSRDWKRRSAAVKFFIDAHNVYNRQNVSGLDVKLDLETSELTSEPEIWPRFFASAGISWEF